jgi:hypothetical protein
MSGVHFLGKLWVPNQKALDKYDCLGLKITTEIRIASDLISSLIVKARDPNHLISPLNQSVT